MNVKDIDVDVNS